MKSFIGKITGALASAKAWLAHDATKTWDPGEGAIDAALEPLDDVKIRIKGNLDFLLAAQMKEAVYEHAKHGVWCMGVSKENRLLVVLDIGNEVAPLLIKVPLIELMNAALKEGYETIANPDSQAVVVAIQTFARQMGQLQQQQQGQSLGQYKAPSRPNPSAQKVGVITRGLPPDPREGAQA